VAEFVQTLTDGGVTELSPEQVAEISALVDAQAAVEATTRALGEWVRSLDAAAAVPKNYSVANRLAQLGPLPSTVQAARGQGLGPRPASFSG
jgi:hypothetical protein